MVSGYTLPNTLIKKSRKFVGVRAFNKPKTRFNLIRYRIAEKETIK